MLKNSDNKESKLYVITNTNEGIAFSLFLLILDNINQKRKLHANNTRNHRVSQVSLHICARARKNQIVYLSLIYLHYMMKICKIYKIYGSMLFVFTPY